MSKFEDAMCLSCVHLEDETGQCHYNCTRGVSYPYFKPRHDCNYCAICINSIETDRKFCNSCNRVVGFTPSNFQFLKTEATDDPVNHPNHYQTKSCLETIQVIEAFTDGLEGIEAVCTANVIKYICRWKKKNGLQDLKKARWYLGYLIETVINEEKENE